MSENELEAVSDDGQLNKRINSSCSNQIYAQLDPNAICQPLGD